MYHGPRELILGHFESLGFRCPPRKDLADFLVEVHVCVCVYVCLSVCFTDPDDEPS